MQNQFKQILLTQQIIQRLGLTAISKQLSEYNSKHIPVVPRCPQNSTLDLKLSILMQGSHHSYIYTNNNKYVNTGQCEQWVVCTEREANVLVLEDRVKGVLVVSGQIQGVQGVSMDRSFVIRSLMEGLAIISMNKEELLRRYKMEIALRKSQNKYIVNKFRNQFSQLANKLLMKKIQIQVKNLSLGLNFYGHRRLRKLRKYFTQWTIYHYQNKIEKQQAQIINGNYLIEYSNRKLMEKCFYQWRQVRIKRQKRC